MLKAKELAIVANRLEAPMAVSDILSGRERMTKDVIAALHDVISDQQPDAALLCVAICARKIAGAHAKASPSLRVLEIESGRIIDDYAELWLRNAESGAAVDEFEALDAVSRVAEDLEEMAEMLEINMSYLREIDAKAYTLCNILSIQARSHALVAEAFMEAIDDAVYAPPASSGAAPVMAARTADNVVRFPTGKRA